MPGNRNSFQHTRCAWGWEQQSNSALATSCKWQGSSFCQGVHLSACVGDSHFHRISRSYTARTDFFSLALTSIYVIMPEADALPLESSTLTLIFLNPTRPTCHEICIYIVRSGTLHQFFLSPLRTPQLHFQYGCFSIITVTYPQRISLI